MEEMINFEGRMLSTSQISQLELTRTAVKILRAAGLNAQCRELITCKNPELDSAMILVKLKG